VIKANNTSASKAKLNKGLNAYAAGTVGTLAMVSAAQAQLVVLDMNQLPRF
jgi:hypothetical protein